MEVEIEEEMEREMEMEIETETEMEIQECVEMKDRVCEMSNSGHHLLLLHRQRSRCSTFIAVVVNIIWCQ